MEINIGIKMAKFIMMIGMPSVNYYRLLFVQMEINYGFKMVNFIMMIKMHKVNYYLQ